MVQLRNTTCDKRHPKYLGSWKILLQFKLFIVDFPSTLNKSVKDTRGGFHGFWISNLICSDKNDLKLFWNGENKDAADSFICWFLLIPRERGREPVFCSRPKRYGANLKGHLPIVVAIPFWCSVSQGQVVTTRILPYFVCLSPESSWAPPRWLLPCLRPGMIYQTRTTNTVFCIDAVHAYQWVCDGRYARLFRDTKLLKERMSSILACSPWVSFRKTMLFETFKDWLNNPLKFIEKMQSFLA